MKIIFVFLFVVTFSSICNKSHAQSERETIDWLTITLNKMRRDTEYTRMGYSAATGRDSVTKEMYLIIGLDARSPKDNISAIVHVPLKRVVVCDNEEGDKLSILFITRTGTMDGLVVKNDEIFPMNYHSYKMLFENNEFNRSMMKRLVKAFQRLIKLAGGKVPEKGLFY